MILEVWFTLNPMAISGPVFSFDILEEEKKLIPLKLGEPKHPNCESQVQIIQK